VYSLGVILFRVLAGALPFSGQSLYEKMIGSTKGERPSLRAKRPDLPSDVDDWVLLALAIDREQRFQNVRALWNAFLTTFRVAPPERGKRSSLWAKAAGKAKRLAGIVDSARSADPLTESNRPPLQPEPSFIAEALRRSIPNVPSEPTPSDAAVPSGEATLELPRVVEPTLELADDEFSRAPPSFHPVEKTLELSGEDLVAEDALPDAALIEGIQPDAARVEKTLPTGTRVEGTVPGAKPVSGRSGKAATNKKGGSSFLWPMGTTLTPPPSPKGRGSMRNPIRPWLSPSTCSHGVNRCCAR
jgi:serine/threonine protein kinase